MKKAITLILICAVFHFINKGGRMSDLKARIKKVAAEVSALTARVAELEKHIKSTKKARPVEAVPEAKKPVVKKVVRKKAVKKN